MANTKAWLSAFRLRTLPLAVSSILLGSAIAYYNGEHDTRITLLAILTAILLQVLSNLANDLGDHQHGTDNDDRVGPQRAVQSGDISPEAMKRGMIICGLLAFISGLALIIVAFGFSKTTLIFLGIGLASIAAAIKYTYGKNPYGYSGLGDLFVFLFFGMVGVAGTSYLHMHVFTVESILFSLVLGMLSASVLNLNNMRDIEGDMASGKRTLAVFLGKRTSKIYQALLVLIPCITSGAWLFKAAISKGYPTMLNTVLIIGAVIICIPLLINMWKMFNRNGKNLDPLLKIQALSIFGYSLFLSFLYYMLPW